MNLFYACDFYTLNLQKYCARLAGQARPVGRSRRMFLRCNKVYCGLMQKSDRAARRVRKRGKSMAVDLQEVRKLCDLLAVSTLDDHFNALGMKVVDIAHGSVTMELPYAEALVGNPDTGVIHGGAITALLDSCCGLSAATALDELALTPTIDLRIDYLGPAAPHQSVVAVGEVYRVTRHVIFTRAVAHQGDPQRPIAQAVGNFSRLEKGTFSEFRDMILKTHEHVFGGQS